MPIVKTKNGRLLLKKASALLLLPYRYDSNLSQYVLGQNLYDLSAIIGDSISLVQQDEQSETKNNEFTNTPLVKNVISGEWTFEANIIDFQNSVLKALFAAYTYNDDLSEPTVKAAAFRNEYDTLYSLIIIKFKDTNMPYIWLPKVQMNSKFILQQLRTRCSQGNIKGTLFSSKCGIVLSTSTSQGHTIHNLMPFADNINGGNEYTPDTPVVFAPQNLPVIVYNHRVESDKETYFDQPKLNVTGNNDCCMHNIVVSDSAKDRGVS